MSISLYHCREIKEGCGLPIPAPFQAVSLIRRWAESASWMDIVQLPPPLTESKSHFRTCRIRLPGGVLHQRAGHRCVAR